VAHAEASARTVEAAVTAAAAQLGLHSDQVDIEVLEDPVPSTFGFIGSPARVRVTPRTTTHTPTASGSGGAGSGGAEVAGPGAGSGGSGPTGSWSAGSRLTDSGSTDGGPTGSGPADQPVLPSSPEASQDLDPGQPRNQAQTPELDQNAQAAQSAAPTMPADLTQTSDPTDASSVTASTPDPGAGIPSAPQASDQVPTTASGPTTAQEPASSPAGAPSVPTAQPTPVGADGDQPPAAVAVHGEQPSGSTSGAGDPASSIGTQADSAATTTARSGSDGAPSATTELSSSTRPARRTYRDEPIEPAMVEADTERAGDFLEGLLDALDVDGDITTWVDEVGGHIDLEGPDLDMLVGSNGETLDALQELTRLAVLRQSKRRVRLLLDINGFRARQRERLVTVVRATAEQVIKSQEDHEFQPMTPAERKIVHDAVAAIEGVTTESLGEEPNRRVVIQPT
jgi:spoIIIJ-associated protein